MSALAMIAALAALLSPPTQNGEVKTAGELGLGGLPPETQVLVLPSDPQAKPVEAIATASLSSLPMGSGESVTVTNYRNGCPDLGFSQYAYARDTGSNWPWLPSNTLVADDMTLAPGTWLIDCTDVLIYSQSSVAHALTIQAYDGCNGTPIPGSLQTWTIPARNGPILLTDNGDVHFFASGTIYLGMTSSRNNVDGWYLGTVQAAGSTTNTIQIGTDCAGCIDDCTTYGGFIAVLYGCPVPTITTQPANGQICPGGWNQFCVAVQGSGTIQYQWQKDNTNITGATSACYVATTAGAYRCIVIDGCSTVTSNAATLTVRSGPIVTSPPTGGVVCAGRTQHLCVAADAMGTLHYQWKRGGLTIIGATAACYDAATAGSYTCVLTDDCGTTTSTAAVVVAASPSTGDFNGDGHVNLADWDLLSPCLAGPAAGLGSGCTCEDTDADVDADLADFAVVQHGFGS
jgi:hypothetical protein